MKYYIEKTTEYAFDEAVEKVTEELKKRRLWHIIRNKHPRKAERKAGC